MINLGYVVNGNTAIFLAKYIIHVHDKLRLRDTRQDNTIPGKIAFYMINLGCVVNVNITIFLTKLIYT